MQRNSVGAERGDARIPTPPPPAQMNYSDFLTCLMKLSAKVFPRSRSKDEAFQRLLMDNILPLAARRCPDSVELFLENEDVAKLFDFYAGALEQIFSFYATNDKRAHAANTASASAGAMGSGAGMGLSHTGRSPIRATRAINSMKEAMGYAIHPLPYAGPPPYTGPGSLPDQAGYNDIGRLQKQTAGR